MDVNPFARLAIKGASPPKCLLGGGDSVQARVVKELGDGQYLLNAGGRSIVVSSDAALSEGEMLQMTVKRASGEMMLEVFRMSAGPLKAQGPSIQGDAYIPASAEGDLPASLFEADPMLTRSLKNSFDTLSQLAGIDLVDNKLFSEIRALVEQLPVSLENIAQNPGEIERAIESFKHHELQAIADKIESAVALELKSSPELVKLDTINSFEKMAAGLTTGEKDAAVSFLSGLRGEAEFAELLGLFDKDTIRNVLSKVAGEFEQGETPGIKPVDSLFSKQLPSTVELGGMSTENIRGHLESLSNEQLRVLEEYIKLELSGTGQSAKPESRGDSAGRVLEVVRDVLRDRLASQNGKAAGVEGPAPDVAKAVLDNFANTIKNLPELPAEKIAEMLFNKLTAEQRDVLLALLNNGKIPRPQDVSQKVFDALLDKVRSQLATAEPTGAAREVAETVRAELASRNADTLNKYAEKLVGALVQKGEGKEIGAIVKLAETKLKSQILAVAERREAGLITEQPGVRALRVLNREIANMGEQVLMNRVRNAAYTRQSPSLYYAEVPVSVGGELRSAKFKVFCNRGQSGKIDSNKPFRVVIALDMTAVGSVRSDLNFWQKGISGSLELANEDAFELFNENREELRAALEKVGYADNLAFSLMAGPEKADPGEDFLVPGHDQQIDLKI